MKLELSDEQIQSAVSAAILQGISQENRDVLIKSAIEHLITPPNKESYQTSPSPSPLQAAFNHAVSDIARNMCHEELKKDSAVKEKIREIIAKAVEKMTLNEEKIAAELANAITGALRNY